MTRLLDALKRLETRSPDSQDTVAVAAAPSAWTPPPSAGVSVSPELSPVSPPIEASEPEPPMLTQSADSPPPPLAESPSRVPSTDHQVNPPEQPAPAARCVPPQPADHNSPASSATSPAGVDSSFPPAAAVSSEVEPPSKFDSPFTPRTSRPATVRPEGQAELTAPVSLRSIYETKSSSPRSAAGLSAAGSSPAALTSPAPSMTQPIAAQVAGSLQTMPATSRSAEGPASAAAGAPVDSKATSPDASAALSSAADVDSFTEEGLLGVCDRLFARLPHEDRAILAFAGVSENEVHALAIQELAAVMAEEMDDPVLVVDGAPQLAFSRAAGVRSAPRLDELAVGRFSWQELVVQTTTPGLCVLPLCAGPVPSDNPESMTRLLSSITGRYPCVLIDLGGCDSTLCTALLNVSDGAILMLEVGNTPVEDAVSALHCLSAFRPPVLGSLLVKRVGAK